MLAAVAVGLGSTLACAAHGGGHGGGGGHAFGGYGFHGGYGHGFHGGYGFRGYYGYPGWYPFGLGLGLGLGLGYGYGGYGYGGYGYGYPYYPYYPCPAGYPVYVSPGYGPPAPASSPVRQVAGQGPAPGAPGGPVQLTDGDALLNIRVPPDAVVRINGRQTTQNGPRREFVSSGLAPGRTYTFVVTAHWAGPDGRAVEQEQRVHVQGGERRNVDFLAPPPPPQDLPLVHRPGS
jgi:uncharacterized protein (TIGR03000 family)